MGCDVINVQDCLKRRYSSLYQTTRRHIKSSLTRLNVGVIPCSSEEDGLTRGTGETDTWRGVGWEFLVSSLRT